MKKATIALIIILVMITTVTQAAVIYISNTSAADSINATRLTSKIDALQAENIDLQSKILSLASYTRIASRAAQLGFESKGDFVSVYSPLPVAMSQ